jgi:hypothetical protein
VWVAVGVFAEEPEPVVPAGFQVGRAIAGEPLACGCLRLEETRGDFRGVAACELPVEDVGPGDLGAQVLEGALGSAAVPSAVTVADLLVREGADDYQARVLCVAGAGLPVDASHFAAV